MTYSTTKQMWTKVAILSLLCIAGTCLVPMHAQESCYEQYLREHNKKILTAEDADDSYDELKKTVLAKQMYGDSYLLKVDTVAQRTMITKADGTYVADVHVALVDSTWYMWLSVDPLADQNIQNSPYMYCNGNPIMLIDPDGRAPSDEEAAWMAEYVYGDNAENRDKLKTQLRARGWEESKYNTSIQMDDPTNGFQSKLFERSKDGAIEYAYVFAGTDKNSLADLAADAGQIWGFSSQYRMAIENAKTLSTELGKTELAFIGHSLGGGEAAAASMATGRLAITFNPAAVSLLTYIGEGLFLHRPNIQNHVVVGDFVNTAQILANPLLSRYFLTRLIILPGTTQLVLPTRINTHSMQNFIK